jgi:hypothetical protein
MREKKPCSLVVVRKNKRLTGTAAQLVHISECGGWDAFLEGIADRVIGSFAQAYNDAARRPRLQAVGGTTQEVGV